jgi:hypothetical protein
VHLTDAISLGGVAVSVFSAGWAVLSARRARSAEEKANGYQASAEQHARRATLAAEESATAQRQSAAAEKRVADAIEKQNRSVEDQAEVAEGVSWRLEHREGAMWELWNDSDYPKFKVTIGGPGVSQNNRTPLIDRIDGHSSVDFWGTTHWGAKPQVVVTWYRQADAQGDPLTWTGTRPAGD